jgi:hypothetical protein
MVYILHLLYFVQNVSKGKCIDEIFLFSNISGLAFLVLVECGHNFCLQIQRSGFDSRRYQIF